MRTRWRAAATLTASALLALCVYRVAERAQHPPAVIPVPRAATLDGGSLGALSDLMRALAPAELLPPVDDGVDTLLTAVQWSSFLSADPQPEARQPGELSDGDLDRIEGLIGPAAAGREDV